MSDWIKERHIFVTPQKEDDNYFSDRFCKLCDKYIADKLHFRAGEDDRTTKRETK